MLASEYNMAVLWHTIPIFKWALIDGIFSYLCFLSYMTTLHGNTFCVICSSFQTHSIELNISTAITQPIGHLDGINTVGKNLYLTILEFELWRCAKNGNTIEMMKILMIFLQTIWYHFCQHDWFGKNNLATISNSGFFPWHHQRFRLFSSLGNSHPITYQPFKKYFNVVELSEENRHDHYIKGYLICSMCQFSFTVCSSGC